MKRILFVLTFLIPGSYLFNSCSKKEANPEPIPEPITGQWIKLNASVYTGSDNIKSFAIGDKGYIISDSKQWEFDPSLDKWSPRAPFPGDKRIGGELAFSIGTKGYYGCGIWIQNTTTIFKNDLWEYDPSSDTWTRKSDFPNYSIVDGVGMGIGTLGYVIGGWGSDSKYMKDVYEYDPHMDTWLKKGDFPGSARRFQFALNLDTKGFAGMGGNSDDNNIRELWQYDPLKDQWTKKADYPYPPGIRPYLGFNVQGKIYTYGGSYLSNNNHVFLQDCFEYDPSIDKWKRKTFFPGDARSTIVCFGINNKGYMGMGTNNVSVYTDFWEFTP